MVKSRSPAFDVLHGKVQCSEMCGCVCVCARPFAERGQTETDPLPATTPCPCNHSLSLNELMTAPHSRKPGELICGTFCGSVNLFVYELQSLCLSQQSLSCAHRGNAFQAVLDCLRFGSVLDLAFLFGSVFCERGMADRPLNFAHSILHELLCPFFAKS